MFKTVYWSLLVLCGGFAVLEYVQNHPQNATMWLIAFAAVVLIHSLAESKNKKPAKSTMESLLEPETQEALSQGQTLSSAPSGIRLRSSETCLWYDKAAQNYYDGKQGTMILTDQRILFVAEGFSFTHSLEQVKITPTRNGIEIDVSGKKMRFVTASTPLLIEIWERNQ